MQHTHASRIQSCWRGFSLRKHFKQQNDNYSYAILLTCINQYLTELNFTRKINNKLSVKKRRNPNMPSDISENIAKFAIAMKYNVMPCWDTDKGDIVIHKKNLFKQIEVKSFMSNGPTSFGPCSWDWLYFVDARDIRNLKFKVYEVKLSNNSPTFRNILVNKTETFGQQIDQGRRPRGVFDNIFKPQLAHHCKLIFHGHVSNLLI